MSSLQAPRGTFDVLPADAARRLALETHARRILGAAGYGRIETPTYEATELFARGVGEATDIVQKEMYSFDDGGGRSMTLRPEGTAPVCRAYLEHGMHKLPQPVKLWYLSSFFRAEAPQTGRYRQFWQVGAEAIGAAGPETDAELILLLADLLRAVGVKDTRLRLSSLGTAETRREYREELAAFLHAHEDGLSRRGRQPDRPQPDAGFRRQRPRAPRRRCATRRSCWTGSPPRTPSTSSASRRCSTTPASPTSSIPTLVRGLDYYARTLCSSSRPARWARSRPSGAAGAMTASSSNSAARPRPGVGWAAGIERMLMAAGEQPVPIDLVDLFVAIAARDSAAAHQAAFKLANDARRAGLSAQLELAGRGLKGQLKHADRIGARYVAIIGDPMQISLKDMEAGNQTELEPGRGDPHDPAREPHRVKHAPRANVFRDSWAGELDAERAGSTARVSGWVHRRRDHGGLIFIDLRERSGIVQLVFNPATAAEAHAEAHKLRSEDVITAAERSTSARRRTSTPTSPPARSRSPSPRWRSWPTPRRRRSPSTRTAPWRRTSVCATGRWTCAARRCRTPSRCATAWSRPSATSWTSGTSSRSRRRFSPARRPRAPATSSSRPGSPRAPSTRCPSRPQLFKQLLMIGGFERYYQIVRCFRDEDARADRLPEFTQLDVEMAFVDEEDVLETSEAAIGAVFAQAGFDVPAPPWPRMTHAEAVSRFGSDRPDTRFGLELDDLGDAVTNSEFKVFSGALESGGVVRGINAGARELTRSDLDALTELAKQHGAKGLVWAFVQDEAGGADDRASWAITPRASSRTTGRTRSRTRSRTTCSRRRIRGRLPSHLFLVVGVVGDVSRSVGRDELSVRPAGAPGSNAADARQDAGSRRTACPSAVPVGGRSTWLLDANHVSVGPTTSVAGTCARLPPCRRPLRAPATAPGCRTRSRASPPSRRRTRSRNVQSNTHLLRLRGERHAARPSRG